MEPARATYNQDASDVDRSNTRCCYLPFRVGCPGLRWVGSSREWHSARLAVKIFSTGLIKQAIGYFSA